MKNLICFFVLILFVGSNVFGQRVPQKLSSNLNLYAPSLIDFHNKVTNAKTMEVTENSDVAGSPYLDNEFHKGLIITKDSVLYSGVYLRYNNYKDVMEFKKENFVYEVPNQFPVMQINFDGKIFEKRLFHSKEGLKLGFFQRVVKGNTSLYFQQKVIFKETKPAKGYQAASVPVFIKKSPIFHLQLNPDDVVTPFTNKKELLSILSNKKKELNNFIKQNRLKIKNEGDLVKIVNFYNSL